MNGFETDRGNAQDFGGAPEPRNVCEIFPGARRQAPVVNRPARPAAAGGLRQERRWARHGMEAGMATAEYAIATLAAVGFAGLLVVILKSDEVRGFLLNIIRAALSF